MAKNKQSNPRPAAPKAPVVNKPAASLPPSKASGAPSDKLLIIFLVALAFIINIRTLNYDYTLDDPFFTKENPFVKEGTSALPDIFTHAAYYGVFKNHDASYRPFLLTSFAIENEMFGFDPKISHLINLIFFALQLTVLFLLLRRIFRQYSPWIPFFILLLFAVHPIHTEVVASIKSRDEIMALLFASMCLLQSIKYIDEKKTINLVLSGVLFFCALMSKEAPITLVVLTPLTIYFFRNAKTSEIVKATVPYLVVAGIYMLMRTAFVENDSGPVVILVNNNALMAAETYAERLATLLFIQLKYIILLIVPHPLSWDYSYNQIPIIGFGNIKAIAAVAVIIGMLVYAIMNFKKKDIFAYCIIFYALSVIITSNLLVVIGATMAERFVFTASLAFCMAVVFLLAKLFKLDLSNINLKTTPQLFAVIGIVAVLYSIKTFARNEAWRDNRTLYESGVETAPNSWRAHNLLGVEYTKSIGPEKDPKTKKELYDKAIYHFNRSSAILPSTEVYLLKGYANEFIGNDDSALACYQKVVSLDSNYKMAYGNMGGVFLRKGRLDEAIVVLKKAIAIDTAFTDAYSNLGASYGNKGMFRESEYYYMIAIRQNPNQPKNVLQSISNIYRFLGDSVKSQQYQQRANQAPQ
jgi:tetratricopeptide (TPR) repeat protein